MPRIGNGVPHRETIRSESRRNEGFVERAIGVQARHTRSIDSVYCDEIAGDDDLAITIDNRIGPQPAAAGAEGELRAGHLDRGESRIDSAVREQPDDTVPEIVVIVIELP